MHIERLKTKIEGYEKEYWNFLHDVHAISIVSK